MSKYTDTVSKKLFHPLKMVTVRPSDARRLRPHLASSGRLNEILVLDSISTEDLKRMLIMESGWEDKRYVIVRKLVARILARERDRMILVAYGAHKANS